MSATSSIEWTEATWNPVTGCTKVSPGCDNCYAERITERFHGKGSFTIVRRDEGKLYLPLKWRKPRRIFVNSMSDLFHDDVPAGFIGRVFSVMAQTPQHTYQVLTKRHGRMRSLLRDPDFRSHTGVAVEDWPLANVWLGVSVEDQQWADTRIRHLVQTPAAVRWLSCEPLLGPVDLRQWLGGTVYPSTAMGLGAGGQTFMTGPGIDWVVVGGESGPGSRPMMPGWARSLRDQCTTADVPFFFKQWGEFAPMSADVATGKEIRAYPGALLRRTGKKLAGRELDGRTWDEYPATLAERNTP